MGFVRSHAKRESARIEVLVDTTGLREGRSYGIRLTLDGRTIPPPEAPPIELTSRRSPRGGPASRGARRSASASGPPLGSCSARHDPSADGGQAGWSRPAGLGSTTLDVAAARWASHDRAPSAAPGFGPLVRGPATSTRSSGSPSTTSPTSWCSPACWSACSASRRISSSIASSRARRSACWRGTSGTRGWPVASPGRPGEPDVTAMPFGDRHAVPVRDHVRRAGSGDARDARPRPRLEGGHGRDDRHGRLEARPLVRRRVGAPHRARAPGSSARSRACRCS